jgi:branched-chain amino acid transport system substrate-binding protein
MKVRIVAALMGAALTTTACGSTLTNDQLNAQARESFRISSVQGGAASPGGGAPTGAVTAATSDPAAPAAAATAGPGGASTPGGSGAASSPARSSTAASGAQSGVPSSSSAAAPKPASGINPSASAAPPGGGGANPAVGTPSVPGSPAAPTGGSKTTIALGSFGTQTGPIGRILLPVPQGARAWAADVNARGGLAGHPVKLILADDGGDPNKALSIVRRMVEEDKVLAFYAEFGPTTIQAALPYLEQKQIPVIGGCNCFQGAAESPMVFQVGIGSKYGLAWEHLLPFKAYAPNEKKASLQYCREAPTCKTMADDIRKLAPQAGIEIVHEAQTTLTQPDYTAEVLAARNAGANLLILATESFSAIRTIRSAHRQDWHPQVATQHSAVDARFIADGGADVEGVLLGAGIVSWDSPKMADYRAAIDRYAPGAVLANISQFAYMAGKLLEKMAASWPAQPGTADVVKGLYALNGETLGGTIPPLAYKEGVGHDSSDECVIPTRVEGGKFVPQNGDTFLCAPGWQPVQK